MRTFHVLVVDNEEEILTLAEEAAGGEDGITVETASTADDAHKLIVSNFFHVALIDLNLQKGSKVDDEGLSILRTLEKVRPTCRRLLLTENYDGYRHAIYEMLQPDRRLIDGIVDKIDFGQIFVDQFKDDAGTWLRAPVDVVGLDELYDSICGKSIQVPSAFRRPIAITRDETDHLVSSLFGQGLLGVADETSDVASITLRPLAGGKSRSVVYAGRPVDQVGDEGISCVVKIGSRNDTMEELHRYDRYVRFRLSLHRRVEMLGHVLGDTLGAICYSFAGTSPDSISSLQTLLDSHDERVHRVIEQLLGDEEDWHHPGPRVPNMAGFFGTSYGLSGERVAARISAFARRHAQEFGGRYEQDDNTIVFDGGKLVLPGLRLLGSGHLRCAYSESIVHGDLNAGNVLVSNDDDDVTLIDFRYTTRGPIAVDLAALHTSVRLIRGPAELTARQILADHQIEIKLWSPDFGDGSRWWPEQATGVPPFWAEVSATLMRLAVSPLEIERRELLATMLLYSLRVARVRDLEPSQRMRLLVWISALQHVLARLPATAGRSAVAG